MAITRSQSSARRGGRRRSLSWFCRSLILGSFVLALFLIYKFVLPNSKRLGRLISLPRSHSNNMDKKERPEQGEGSSEDTLEIMEAKTHIAEENEQENQDGSIDLAIKTEEVTPSDKPYSDKGAASALENNIPFDDPKEWEASQSMRSHNIRTQSTTVDRYFQHHQKIPKPNQMHIRLPELVEDESRNRKRILVIGDVHGCFDAMLEMYETAKKEHNDGNDFDFVILVGDLVNKGPDSAKVVRYLRLKYQQEKEEKWLTVRGNHDDGALEAACGATKRTGKKYKWVMQGEEDATFEQEEEVSPKSKTKAEGITLSDDDTLWMSELPYSITIPGEYLGDNEDTVIVHGGLIPGVDLEQQEIPTMITIREVLPVCKATGESSDSSFLFEYHERIDGDEAEVGDELICKVPRPWANVWKGPYRVIFGHDARRGLQRYEGDWAIGLDSGAVYGRGMTAIILPERKLVTIETQAYA